MYIGAEPVGSNEEFVENSGVKLAFRNHIFLAKEVPCQYRHKGRLILATSGVATSIINRSVIPLTFNSFLRQHSHRVSQPEVDIARTNLKGEELIRLHDGQRGSCKKGVG